MKKAGLFLLVALFSATQLYAISSSEEEELEQIILELEQIYKDQAITLSEQSITIENLKLSLQEQEKTIQNLETATEEQENSFNEQKKSWIYKTIGITAGGTVTGFIIGVLICLL